MQWIAPNFVECRFSSSTTTPRIGVASKRLFWRGTWFPMCAPDGRVAFEMIKRSVEEGRPYRLLLIDSEMPGMNGLELAEQVP